LSKIIPSSGLGPGQDEVGQKSSIYSIYDVTHKTSEIQNQKNSFHCRLKDLLGLLRFSTAL